MAADPRDRARCRWGRGMSVEAISWALNLAPVPADSSGQPSSASKFVLVGLANHASPDGSCAFPSVRTLTRYTGLSERTVRTCLDRALSSVRVSGQQVVAGQNVVAIDATRSCSCGLRRPSAAGEFAAEFKVLAVGLLQGCA